MILGKEKARRNVIRKKLLQHNIESRPFLAGDFTIQPVVNNFEHFKDLDLKVSQSISEDGLAIPCDQEIREKDIKKIFSVIKDFLDEAM